MILAVDMFQVGFEWVQGWVDGLIRWGREYGDPHVRSYTCAKFLGILGILTFLGMPSLFQL